MHKGRLEAFSDGVIAIIITIMVLEIKVPDGGTFWDLWDIAPHLLSYVLSFAYVGIYWNNHHHLFQTVKKVDGKVLWANLVLLFFLSLIPLASEWMGENHFRESTVTCYGAVLLACAASYYVLTLSLLSNHEAESSLHRAVGAKVKERLSLALYFAGILASLQYPVIGFLIYCVVAVVWLLPDRRIEREMGT